MSNLVSVRNLSIGYRGDAVVAGLSFGLGAGESIALVGGNGSGKSTLLRTIAGLLAPLGGEIVIARGQADRSGAPLAYLPQLGRGTADVPLRAIDVVRTGRYGFLGLLRRWTHADTERVDEAMERMAVSSFADRPFGALSGGQRQRVLLARMLVEDGDVVLLDEPTAGLDVVAVEHYRVARAALRERGAAVIVATHDLADARSCDYIVVLERGAATLGLVDDLLAPERLLSALGSCCP